MSVETADSPQTPEISPKPSVTTTWQSFWERKNVPEARNKSLEIAEKAPELSFLACSIPFFFLAAFHKITPLGYLSAIWGLWDGFFGMLEGVQHQAEAARKKTSQKFKVFKGSLVLYASIQTFLGSLPNVKTISPFGDKVSHALGAIGLQTLLVGPFLTVFGDLIIDMMELYISSKKKKTYAGWLEDTTNEYLNVAHELKDYPGSEELTKKEKELKKALQVRFKLHLCETEITIPLVTPKEAKEIEDRRLLISTLCDQYIQNTVNGTPAAQTENLNTLWGSSIQAQHIQNLFSLETSKKPEQQLQDLKKIITKISRINLFKQPAADNQRRILVGELRSYLIYLENKRASKERLEEILKNTAKISKKETTAALDEFHKKLDEIDPNLKAHFPSTPLKDAQPSQDEIEVSLQLSEKAEKEHEVIERSLGAHLGVFVGYPAVLYYAVHTNSTPFLFCAGLGCFVVAIAYYLDKFNLESELETLSLENESDDTPAKQTKHGEKMETKTEPPLTSSP